ncbi:pilus retraction protein PilT [Thermanaerovibrio velox DSM 12556]|uniref:Pilus retraction protein PilT n=1 Tax=Thermanaerovibrio velox DSM 12556 TaxID=926567 RepID=H0URD9_9BACT|nr:type IV pilus twitching motility protein PilT [Thermanaerovibrio velox]EHM09895.1 pilus retraction protein PilT [Thermanaerovibrio velox DSM 12556]
MSVPSLKVLLYEMVKRKASDLHISSSTPPMLRVDGTLIPFDLPDLTPNDVMEYLGDLLPPGRHEEFIQKRELDFSFTMVSLDTMPRFRVNCFFEKGNPAIAIRSISTDIRTMEQLKLPREMVQVAEKMRGLFLVTGPTGSGKSTTLAALIQQINMNRSCHIVTVEDPIEYVFRSERAMIHQREVGDDTMSFSEALRRVLRQDPDVIMIGEMRDLETISAAITAAETGHLVLATLHTPDAAQTVDRIVDVFPPYQQQQVRLQLANILIGICSQQLIPLDGGGRVVATELLWATPGVRNCIREGKTSQIKSMMQTGSSIGMHSMDQDLVRLYREGILSREAVEQYCFDTKEVEHLLGGAVLMR